VIPLSDQARRTVKTGEDQRGVEACYLYPDVVVPAPRGFTQRRIGSGWVLVVLADGTVDLAFRRP
jgi:hypothetical protein